jgi:DNA mismatch repair protein MutL
VYSLVLGSVRSRLGAANLTARLQPTNSYEARLSPMPAPNYSLLPPPEQGTPRTLLPPSFPAPAPTPSPSPLSSPGALDQAFNGSVHPAPAANPELTTAKAFQLYNAYLVLETGDGLLVIDQHALHERILFEQIKRRLRGGSLETQRLLIPEPVELTAEQGARTLEARPALADLGLGLEDFGGGTVLVTSYPAILGHRSPQSILKVVVDHLMSKDRVPTREVLLNNLMSLMACHAAVRAGDPLNQEEIAALVAQREMTSDSHHCPHGRPTALLFTRQDLDRQFRRT